MDKKLDELAKYIVNQQKEMVKQTLLVCKPEVDKIISSGSRDIKTIEHTLDVLCDVAFDNDVLALFKRLCRYYYDIDSRATVDYILIYREMWDSEDENSSKE